MHERQSGVARGPSSVTASVDPKPAATGDCPGRGNAHDQHFGVVIFGRAAQQGPQQDAVRSRHGSSFPQATHHDGRTIRSASRPTRDNALASVRTRSF